ncbi:dihydrolipoyl dehydrogenase [Mycoplasmopsis gallinacea]|uniref:Dihydrolipoyl dehydrogenase n=1 Tax=Mycoplasmopsis gallinacea TaxID=29556 RepID=A0A449A3Y0_9BACT|nr:dihydrolipoyl dehydrogenase [Mycoplasmopsis gallinacea]VEU58928.1 pyruvate dehydrogenase E2 component [Mycoplasmopsis gallinacea]
MYKFKFADIGEGLHEGVVAEIYKKVGDVVKEGDSLFSVETDKVTSDIPSPVDGKIVQVLMNQGDTIHVGQEIYVIDDGSGDDAEAAAPAQESQAESAPASEGAHEFYSFKFADIGEGLHEGVVAEIYKKEGDTVKEGDSLFSVETDKVTSDIPSPVDGKIVKVLMNQGDTIHVGQEIYVIDDGKKHSNAAAPAAAKASGGGASVVGVMEVNDDLLDFSSLSASSSSTKAEVSAPKQEAALASSDASFDEGKAYTGAIEEEFDVIVVGSGPGGYLAAEEAGKSGLKTMIVEKKYWGGVCLNTGCIPTKSLLKSTEIISDIKHAEKYGVVATSSIDNEATWKSMHERKTGVVSKISKSVEMLMKSSKVKSLFGEAKFVGAREIEVNSKVYRAKNIILATGSTANQLAMLPGFKEGYENLEIITSEEAINWDKSLPKKVTIIGGGVIGLEFATVFATAGAEVTILQNTDKLLPMNEPEVAQESAKMLDKMGVKVLYNAQSQKYEGKKLYVLVDGKETVLEQDIILTATGRSANSKGLAEVGVKLGQRGEVIVDKHQRTNVRNVYAIGDVTGQNMLAHVAYAHALVAVSHILGDEEKGTYKPKGIPGCIYTTPEIAFVGLTEAEAKKQGRNVFASKYLFEYLGKAIAASHTEGFIKLIVDKEFGEILGATIVGANATDYITEVLLAMEQEVTVHEIAHTIHPHPTYNEIIWEAARSASLKLDLEKHKK